MMILLTQSGLEKSINNLLILLRQVEYRIFAAIVIKDASIHLLEFIQHLIYIILALVAPGIMVAGFYSFVVSWIDYIIV